VSRDAASKGNAAFLFPAGVTSPFNATPPSIMNLSMNISLKIDFGVNLRRVSPRLDGIKPAFARVFHSWVFLTRRHPLAACAIVRQFAGFGKKGTPWHLPAQAGAYS
jgi:hypothetical protein